MYFLLKILIELFRYQAINVDLCNKRFIYIILIFNYAPNRIPLHIITYTHIALIEEIYKQCVRLRDVYKIYIYKCRLYPPANVINQQIKHFFKLTICYYVQ